MPDPLQTTVSELPESRVRLRVEVSPEELERRVQKRATALGRELKLPGFRKGKVPAALVLQRLGWDAVLEEVVREGVSGWYVAALAQSDVVPVGDPEVDLGELPKPGQPLAFSIEVGVLPKATLGQYKGLEVGRAEAAVAQESIAEELERIRERLARLESVERGAEMGDFVVIDYEGALAQDDGAVTSATAADRQALEGALRGRDRMVELGSGRLLDGFEEALVGAGAGEEREVRVTFGEDAPESALAGRTVAFGITVKDVKERELPELDDELAVGMGFDTLEELREDLHEQLAAHEESRIASEFRDAALDAAVGEAEVSAPSALVKARAQEMWERMVHSLSHRGISKEVYLQMDGRSEEQVLSELEPDAERALKREAVLTAIVAAEQIEPGETELLEALAPVAQERDVEAAALLEELRRGGRLEELAEDLAARRAIDLIASEAKPIPLARARAREQLWTPDAPASAGGRSEPAQTPQTAGGLWTPDR